MQFEWVISLLAGLAFFMYGMKIMGDGLEKFAGDRLSKIIDSFTSNKIKGVLIGTAVTAIIQSSSATTVMVIGFINAGIMKLSQAVGVIMGANIGTTVTAFLISMEDINSSATVYLELLKPSFWAPILAAVGVFFILFIGKKKYQNLGMILAGFGFLFVGLGMMESSMSFVQDNEEFQQMMLSFSNPILGVLVGAGVTAIIQSSSASVGILQTLASTMYLPFSSVVPVILGQNIGTCITAILSSIGANKNAKRAAVIHLLFNIIGTVICLILFYAFPVANYLPFWNEQTTRFNIAVFHLTFNIFNTLILLPFSNFLVKCAHIIVPGKDVQTGYNALDERLLATPALAVGQAVKQVVGMAHLAQESVGISLDMLEKQNASKMGDVDENELAIDEMEANTTQYLVKIADEPLTDEENESVSMMFHIITDLERIGDHAYNIAEGVQSAAKEDVETSKKALSELGTMAQATREIVGLAVQAYEFRDLDAAKRIQPCEDVIDLMKETYKMRHVNRLTKQKCNFKSGVLFLDVINNLERIADHCSNIGIAVEQLVNPQEVGYDQHLYMKDLHINKTEEYKQIYQEYLEKYNITKKQKEKEKED
ncbi:MAG TPA: Na/Pi cotransporter family protein [Candidatus Aphodoplasma excrementigallinarum]|uniref:Na/Pi cotransporter family protein n=1 Tax=Candidatus Aphodoplasma excrementigallinarum TaxID=2840673 RepID=A0A9D1T0J9_9FIRM|nr:Na/Pi cotransporter family protein [Candidatus Aphodoplasma excrementigallinarum]